MNTLSCYERGMVTPLAISPGRVSGDAVMLSGSEYELMLLDLPPLRDDELALTMQYRLRALYPGDPEDTVYASLPGFDKRRRAVVVMKREQLDACRALAGDRPLLVSASILARVCPTRKRTLCALWSLRSFEGAVFEAGRVVSLHAYPVEPDRKRGVQALEDLSEGCETIQIVLADDMRAEVSGMRDLVASARIPCTVSLLADRMRPWDANAMAVFQIPPSRTRTAVRIMVAAIPWVCAALCIGAVLRYGALRQQDRDARKRQYELARQAQDRAKHARTALQELESRYAQTRKTAEPSPYELIAAIAPAFGENCRMTTLEVTGSEFRFEAEGIDSLSVLAALESSKQFSHLVLHSSARLDARSERFVISGRYTHAGT